MRKLVFIALVVGCLLVVAGAHATTYYVDYSSGSDGNSGTSKTAPWKHAPGMLGLSPSGGSTGDGCSGTCASTTINPGDKIILKGGTVWPYTVLPWQPGFSGNASSQPYGCAGNGCVYVGYDPTWNQGKVNSVTLTQDLGGCSGTPSVSFSGGGGSGAAAAATIMSSAGGSQEPNVAGFVTSIAVTGQGSAYTSSPTVTISGSGCNATGVADIYRPVIDAGSGSNVTWQVGYGPGATEWGPGLTPQGSSYVIFDHLEIRNILQVARNTNGVPDGVITSFLGNEGGGSGNITYSNNYIHGRYSNCTLNSCNSNDQEGGDRAIILNSSNDEAVGNVVTNGDGYFTGSSATGCGQGFPCEFSEHSIFTGNGGGSVHGNWIYGSRWGTHVGGNSGATSLIYGNSIWLILYDASFNSHVNEMYTLLTTGTLYEYNNIFHNMVSGASNQQQMGNGTTQYFFNNVSWALGGGTPNYGIDADFGAGPSGGHFFFYNNTMYSLGGTNVCINDGGGPNNSALFVTLQNNQCITNQSPYFGNNAGGSTFQNQAGSTSSSAIEASSVVETASSANSLGYLVINLLAPITSGTNDTTSFASSSSSANLSGICSGNLTALCSDINGNPRPTSGGWQAGAYLFTGGSTSTQGTPPAPPTGLSATVQ